MALIVNPLVTVSSRRESISRSLSARLALGSASPAAGKWSGKTYSAVWTCSFGAATDKTLQFIYILNIMWSVYGILPIAKVVGARHELSGIASHFAMHYSWFATQHRFCIAKFATQNNSTNESTNSAVPDRQLDRVRFHFSTSLSLKSRSSILARKIVRFETTR